MKKPLKITVILFVSLFSLAFIAVNLLAWFMKPERLTLIVEEKISESINGKVNIGEVDVSFWSTFPRAELTISDIEVVSHAFNDAPDYLVDELTPADDTLALIQRISLDINVMKAIKGDIDLGDVVIENPRLNLVVADADLANFNIIPRTDSSSKMDFLKNIKSFHVNSFTIKDAEDSRYVSLLDGQDVTFSLPDFSIDGSQSPYYKIDIKTAVTSDDLYELNFDPLILAVNGGVIWDIEQPRIIDVQDLHLGMGDFKFILSSHVNLDTSMSLNDLNFTIDRLKINDIVSHLPEAFAEDYADLDTDLELTLNMVLLDTLYINDRFKVPSARLALDIPECKFYYGETQLSTAALIAHANLNGAELDRSTIDVDTLILAGEGFRLDATGVITHPISDPVVEANVRSDVALDKLPPYILRFIPATLGGHMNGDTGVKLKITDLNSKEFHRISMTGDIDIENFSMKMKSKPINFRTGLTHIGFGRTSDYTDASHMITDSLLMLTLDIDTATIFVPGNTLTASHVTADLANPADISPGNINSKLDAVIHMAMFSCDTHDSVRVRLRDTETQATLSRFPGKPEDPELDFNMTARRFSVRGHGFSMAVSQPVINIKSHRRPDGTVAAAGKLPRRSHINNIDSIIDDDIIDWNLNTALEKILIGWDIRGTLQSDAGFVFLHALPLRQRASRIDMRFNNDSVTFNNFRYTMGQSIFDITGSVSNITRALTSYERNVPLVANLRVNSPFVDINELASSSLHQTSGSAGPDPDYSEEIFEHHITADTSTTRPFIIPRNISACVSMNADSIRYADLILNRMNGTLLIDHSAVNLHDLNATSSVGDINLSGLYWAPDSSDIRMGMGIELTNFDLGRTLEVIPTLGRMLPALHGFTGTVDARAAAAFDLKPDMHLDMSTFKGAIKLEGDSLSLTDPRRFKSLSRWLMFHDSKHINIDHVDLEMVINDRRIDLFPFVFNIDRYRLGVMGFNNLDMDLNYHVSVLKSPIPFKFGINITGYPHDLNITLGGAKLKEENLERFNIAASTHRSLLDEINTVFALGSMSRDALNFPATPVVEIDQYTDSLSADERHWMEQQGWIKPETPEVPEAEEGGKEEKKKHHFLFF